MGPRVSFTFGIQCFTGTVALLYITLIVGEPRSFTLGVLCVPDSQLASASSGTGSGLRLYVCLEELKNSPGSNGAGRSA